MTTETHTLGHRTIGWSGIGIGAGFTVAFTLIADLLGAALRSPAIAVLLAILALFLTGFATLRLRPAALPVEPGIGAAVTVLAFGVARIALTTDRSVLGPPVQLGIALTMGMAMAFLLAWSGALVGSRIGLRRRHQAR